MLHNFLVYEKASIKERIKAKLGTISNIIGYNIISFFSIKNFRKDEFVIKVIWKGRQQKKP